MTETAPDTKTQGAADGLPLVSVIIPVRNEEGYIGRCLQALAAQDYPRERFEVFVLDGGS
ncbi:MAG TPA: glycosyltransferase, partial [Dehalococcoidia bacterium]